jgi:hypothetical protein
VHFKAFGVILVNLEVHKRLRRSQAGTEKVTPEFSSAHYETLSVSDSIVDADDVIRVLAGNSNLQDLFKGMRYIFDQILTRPKLG